MPEGEETSHHEHDGLIKTWPLWNCCLANIRECAREISAVNNASFTVPGHRFCFFLLFAVIYTTRARTPQQSESLLCYVLPPFKWRSVSHYLTYLFLIYLLVWISSTAHLERRGHGRLPPPRPPFAYYEFSSFLPFGNELWTMSLL